MGDTIGFLEINSIARGMACTDALLKAAEVELVFARPGCPGKYYILFTGEVAAVEAALCAGEKEGDGTVCGRCIIPRLHPQVTASLAGRNVPEEYGALGVMEFRNVTAAVYASDAAVKAAEVWITELRLDHGIAGKSFVTVTGAVAAVRAALEAGLNTPSGREFVCGQALIPNPRSELWGKKTGG